MNKAKGFTLIELMVTLAVAAILVSLSLPAFDEFVRNNRRAALVNEFMAAANLARAEALRRGSPVTICRTNQPEVSNPSSVSPDCGSGPNGWEDGWIIFNDIDEDNDWEVGEDLIKASQALDSDIIISGTGTTASRIRFTAIGELQPGVNNGTIRVCNTGDNGANARAIVLAPVGKLRTTETSFSSCPPP